MDRSRSPTPNYSLLSASNSSRTGSEDASSRPPSASARAYSPYRTARHGPRTLLPPPTSAVFTAAPQHTTRDSTDDRHPGASDPEASHASRARAAHSDDEDRSPEEETEAGSGTQPGTSTAPETRKKRTRTLTTPYQSAVLHALLAQSRFPTTQMREEVGRAIGLSARKVQNQRQKAKRNAQNQTATTTAPAGMVPLPQYGPFTQAVGTHGLVSSAGASSLASLEPTFGGPSGQHARAIFAPDPSGTTLGRQPTHRSQPPTVDPYTRPQSSGSQLAGPGIPGAGPTLAPLPEGAPSGLPAFADPYCDPAAVSSRSLSRHSTTSSHSSWRRRRGSSSAGTYDFHPLLPPLVIDHRASSSVPSTGPRPASGPTPFPGSPAFASPSGTPSNLAHAPSVPGVDGPFAYRLADLPLQPLPPLGPGASAQLGLPPPFTLEPAPRWDPAWYHPFARPPSAPALAPPHHADEGASVRSSASSYSPLRERASWDPREPGVLPRVRHVRYDPVRASLGAIVPGPSQPQHSRPRAAMMDHDSEGDADDEGPHSGYSPHRLPQH